MALTLLKSRRADHTCGTHDYTFPSGSTNNNRAAITITKIWEPENNFQFLKRSEGMQHRPKSRRSREVTCAVYGCRFNQRKLRNMLQRQRLDHKPLLGKECACKPSVNSTRCQTMPVQRGNGASVKRFEIKPVPYSSALFISQFCH